MKTAGNEWIPLSKPDIDSDDIAAVVNVLESGQLAMGEVTGQFEQAWAKYCGVRHAILMTNATVALEALLRALGIGPGDEVITVGFTFNATVSAVLHVGAEPRFVDVSERDFCIDPLLIEAAVSPRTRAILPVHLYGQPADMGAIAAIAERRGLIVVEDAAQAHGAEFRGRKVGGFGHAIFSLYATKNLMAGEGGVVTTDDDALAERLRLYRNHGAPARDRHEDLGTNLRATELVAALALSQLSRLDERNARRQRNAARLTEALGSDYLTPDVTPGRTHVWHQYTMRFPGERDVVRRSLAALGVEAVPYYPVAIHRQPYLRRAIPGRSRPHLPVSERLSDEVLSLPVRPNLSDAELTRVISAVRAVATAVR